MGILRQLAVPNEVVFYLQNDSAEKERKRVVAICLSLHGDKKQGVLLCRLGINCHVTDP